VILRGFCVDAYRSSLPLQPHSHPLWEPWSHHNLETDTHMPFNHRRKVVEESMILFGEDCLKNGTRHRLSPLLRDFLHAYLPPDAHDRCAGNTHVAWTRALPYWQPRLVRFPLPLSTPRSLFATAASTSAPTLISFRKPLISITNHHPNTNYRSASSRAATTSLTP
jgi:hypothetical protein